jgi:predicted dehydrogenase
MPRLKIGIVSFAHPHAASYLHDLGARRDVELRATDSGSFASTGTPLRGRAFAERYDVPYVETYEELLSWHPHAVIVCSENTRHAPDAIRAMSIGAHVLVEKPMATTTEEARRMIAASEAAGVGLMVSHPMRFTPMYLALRDLVRDGGLGRILGATGANIGQLPMGGHGWFTDVALSGGGALIDLTVHIADLLGDLLGSTRATSVYAVANRILHSHNPLVDVETAGFVTVRYADGSVATIDCSWSQPDGSPTWGGLTLEVIGTEGVSTIAPFAPHVGGLEAGTGRQIQLAFGVDSTVPMIDEFLASIREGRRPNPDGVAGLRSVAIMEAAQRSATLGTVVSPVS